MTNPWANKPRTHNVRSDRRSGRPIGTITRGTTGINRLRRADRWMRWHPEIARALRHSSAPLVVDLGYGASPTTTCELAARLRPLDSRLRVIGLEIDPARIFPPTDGVEFRLGGFELAGLRPTIVRTFNVLRQYDVAEVTEAWRTMQDQLEPGGFIVEGTCDELGRRCSWVLLDAHGPRTVTLCWDPFHTEVPSDVAERLIKALIHRNVPGDAVHELLSAADSAWARASAFGVYGPRVQWREALRLLRESGVPVEVPRRPLRDCVLTVPWDVVE